MGGATGEDTVLSLSPMLKEGPKVDPKVSTTIALKPCCIQDG